MNQILINSILLAAYFAVLIAIGWMCRKQATDVNGFVLGGRSVGPWLTAFAYGTSYFSAVVFVGYAGQFGWRYGISATWAGIGNALIGSLLAWAVLGRRTRIMTQHLDSATMPDFFAKRFGSPALKIMAAVSGWPWVLDFLALALRHENVYLNFETHAPEKIGMPGSGYEPYLFYGERNLKDRICFASNWATQSLPREEIIGQVEALPCSEDAKEHILYANAGTFYAS